MSGWKNPDGDRSHLELPFRRRRGAPLSYTPRELRREEQGQLHRIGRRQATIAAASDVHEKGALTAFQSTDTMLQGRTTQSRAPVCRSRFR